MVGIVIAHQKPGTNRFFRAIAIMSVLVLAGCSGGLSQSYKQVLSVVVPTEVDFNELEYYALRSQSAYDEPAKIRNTYPDITRIKTLQSVDVRYFLETDKAEGTQTLSIRGTAEKPNIWQDVEATLIPDNILGINLHRGFQDDSEAILQDVKPYLRKDMDIRVTGHSLGAAIALIVSGYLKADGYNITRVVNFGQPKVTGDEPERILADLVTRVVDDKDVVPMLPPPGLVNPYRHIGPEVILRPGRDYVYLDDHDADRVSVEGFWEEFSDFSVKEHFMVNYLANIQGKIEGGSRQVPYIFKGN